MNKIWRVVSGIVLLCLILGVVGIGVGFFMGSSPVILQNHGALPEYMERLQINRDILVEGVRSFLAGFGVTI